MYICKQKEWGSKTVSSSAKVVLTIWRQEIFETFVQSETCETADPVERLHWLAAIMANLETML